MGENLLLIMEKYRKSFVDKDRPAFHVDDQLIRAAEKAAKAFREEELALKRAEYARI